MVISSRTNSIIYLLKRANGYISIKDIASKLDLTERTIYRELTGLTKVLEEHNIRLENTPGKGLCMCGERKDIDSLDQLLNESVVDYGYNGPQVRKDMLLINLLHQDTYIKVQSLASDLRVSIQTVRNDLQQIEESVSNHNVDLIMKKGEGVFLGGNTILKSHYITSIIMENVEVDTFFSWLTHEENSRHSFIVFLEEYQYKAILKEIYIIVLEIIEEKGIKITDTNFMEFIFLLARIALSHANEKDYTDFNVRTHKNHVNDAVVNRLETSLNQLLNIKFSDGERVYLYWLTNITFNKDSLNSIFDVSKINFIQKIRKLIEAVGNRLGVEFNDDPSLFAGLSAHIDRSMLRIRNGLFVSNPMVNEIKTNYNKLFQTIKIELKSIFNEVDFPDSEIGYLTLHFIVSMDKNMVKSLNTLVVCSSGMGSSKMLASRLTREFPEISIGNIIPLMKIQEENLYEYDLIISTIPLHLPNNQYIMVSPLLNGKEFNVVKERITKLNKKERLYINKVRSFHARENGDAAYTIKEINIVTNWGIKVIEGFKVVDAIGGYEEIAIIDFIQNYLFNKGIFNSSNELPKIMDDLSGNDYFHLPNSRLAYLEFGLDNLKEPLLMVFRLSEKHRYSYYSKEVKNIRSVIIMIYPSNSYELLIDFLSDITMMIIEHDDIAYSFENDNEEKLKQILERRIKEYLLRKL